MRGVRTKSCMKMEFNNQQNSAWRGETAVAISNCICPQPVQSGLCNSNSLQDNVTASKGEMYNCSSSLQFIQRATATIMLYLQCYCFTQQQESFIIVITMEYLYSRLCVVEYNEGQKEIPPHIIIADQTQPKASGFFPSVFALGGYGG